MDSDVRLARMTELISERDCNDCKSLWKMYLKLKKMCKLQDQKISLLEDKIEMIMKEKEA